MNLQPDDESLCALIAAGDQQAAEIFDARFRPLLVRFLQGRVPVDQQGDIVQETMLAAFRALRHHGFQARSSLGTWLVGILKHKISDHWDSHKRDNLVPITVSDTKGSTVKAFQHTSDPDTNLALDQMLKQLPKLHRIILLLNVREGITTNEIARAIGMPVGTVGRILWKTKCILRQQLESKKIAAGSDK